MMMNTHVIENPIPALSAGQSPVLPMSQRGWQGVIRGWFERSRQRRALAQIDDRLLADVGISRSAAADEIVKPFWR